MSIPVYSRLPNHIGIIPDGNRRWALNKGLSKEQGYQHGIDPGFRLYQICLELGIKEMTFYGFTQDNNKRPMLQRLAFQKACIDAVRMLSNQDADLLVVGNTESPMFPKELLPYTKERVKFGRGLMKLNFLVNYSWQWDMNHAFLRRTDRKNYDKRDILSSFGSKEISRVDLVVRWGGRRRLSGFLPLQTIYSDFYVIDDMWPDFKKEHIYDALAWYQEQDITLGG